MLTSRWRAGLRAGRGSALRQIGHVWFVRAHLSRHAEWNSCRQSSARPRRGPERRGRRQMAQSSVASCGGAAAGSGAPAAAFGLGSVRAGLRLARLVATMLYQVVSGTSGSALSWQVIRGS